MPSGGYPDVCTPMMKHCSRCSPGLLPGLLGATVTCLLATQACSLGAPGHRGSATSDFDGTIFRNQVPSEPKGLWAVAKWRLTQDRRDWQEVNDVDPGTAPPLQVGMGELHVTFINHSTVLVQLDGLNILTDPIYSNRASPFQWMGPKRYRPPGIRFEDLPPIHAVVVSHNHYDHFDVPTLRRLRQEHGARIVAGLGSCALLEEEGITGAEDVEWWQSLPLSEHVRVTAVPAQHWSQRGVFDARNTLWAGFVITASGGPVYYSGDTGWGPHFQQVHDRFGPPRLAILPVGAFKPRWFMKTMHISPQEAVDAAIVLQAETSLAVHFGTFQLGDDGQEEPPLALRVYLGQLPKPPRFWVLDFGEGRDVPAMAACPTVAKPTAPVDPAGQGFEGYGCNGANAP